MYLSKIFVIKFVFFLLLLSFSFNIITAKSEIENKVVADFNIEFITGTNLNINAVMDVYKLTIDRSYDAEEIKFASDQELGALKFKLYLLLEEQLKGIFENAIFSNFTMPTFDGNIFYESLNVKLVSDFFGLDDQIESDKFINGVLDMGATVNYTFNLKAASGWNNSFSLILPNSIEYKRTTGSVDGNKINWELINYNGEKPETMAEISIKFSNPTTNMLEKEDIYLEFELDNRNRKQTVLRTNILANDILINNYNIVPDFISDLKVVPSDGIRLFIEYNLLSWEEFYNKTIKPIKEITISKIENSSFNQTLKTVFFWDVNTTTNCSIPFDETNMNNNPPILATFIDDNIDIKICGISSKAFLGLINSGGHSYILPDDINFGDDLDAIGLKFDGFLYLPIGINLNGSNIYKWNQSNPISGEFSSEITKDYNSEIIDTFIEIDISNTDFNILSFFTGETELSLDLFIQEKKNYNISAIPNELNIPEKMSLDYLISDAFRLCVEENVFDEQNVTSFLNSNKQLFENRMINILQTKNVEGLINKDLFEKSLQWDENISNMDHISPIKVVSYAHVSYPISFSLSYLPPKFEIMQKTFNFTGLQNQNVTYRMIFPRNVKIKASDNLDILNLGETNDGRKFFDIFFDSSESHLTNTITFKIFPSPMFIFSVFMPCIISLFVTFILVIVIYIINKKRKKKRGTTITNEMDTNPYNDQNYYVPPPSR